MRIDPIDVEQEKELERQRSHDKKQDGRLDDIVNMLKIGFILLLILALFVAINALFSNFTVAITLVPK